VNPKNILTELKRRNVYKVAIAYCVVAWLLMQVASQIFPFFDIPSWGVRLVVLLLIIGFPIALILAWAFELTPEGIKRTEDVDLSKSIRRKTGRKLDFIQKNTEAESTEQAPRSSESLAKSIAVLPFENLSRDPDNAYFAQGIQEEILTRLTSIADLKVISRMSTQRYQSKPGNLSKIAKQLGVRNILEGSVQKVADTVRVNVQLINAQTDSHLWAETYDRQLTDIFRVESEIAKGIAESLQAKLTGREEQALAVKPTNNPEAYDAYLRGLAFEARSIHSFDVPMKAVDSYERAVQLDPNFPLAWARLSRAQAFAYFVPIDTPAARRDAAKRALENAQKLQPNSPETLLALGYYQYHVLRDYGSAKTTFERVSKMLPSSSEVLKALAYIARRGGNWDESIAYFEQALALDPFNMELLLEAASTYTMLRQFPAALKLHDRTLDITPNDPARLAEKAGIYQAEGNLQEAAKLLSEVNAQTPCKNQPDNALLAAGLFLANAVLGEKELALKEAERAITLSPSIKDRMQGPACEEILALVETMVGENSRAISTLTRLLQTPYNSWLYLGPLTASLLRLDPLWDPLRSDPAFQKLCEEKQP